jgi:hypothetical protein
MLLMYEYFKQEKLYRFEPYTANWGKKKGNKKKNLNSSLPANPWLIIKLHYHIQNKLTLPFSTL